MDVAELACRESALDLAGLAGAGGLLLTGERWQETTAGNALSRTGFECRIGLRRLDLECTDVGCSFDWHKSVSMHQFVSAVHCCSRAGISQRVTGYAEGGNGGECLM